MTTLTLILPDTARSRAVPVVSIFGVPWPVHKAAAVVAGVLTALVVFAISGSGEWAMWTSAGTAVAVWWGGYRSAGHRWDDGVRDYTADTRD
ncbi:hypothetical protein [Gordonia shandongensis]|uniref:hypothetical protein n=1 Tax=Gordonia shandongensis TaxID=376351 RepID=UPI00047ADCA6|nr:hypothetical protein [Gordonia shandongensis]